MRPYYEYESLSKMSIVALKQDCCLWLGFLCPSLHGLWEGQPSLKIRPIIDNRSQRRKKCIVTSGLRGSEGAHGVVNPKFTS